MGSERPEHPVEYRRDEAEWHNVGGKEPDGKPTRIGKWTFATKMVRDVVLDHVHGRVLNACAGRTKLQKRGCEFVRNDIDEDTDADTHHDVREVHQHFEPESFDSVILDPPFDPGRGEQLYQGWHGQEYSNARDAVSELVRPGGTVVELGWNSWSLSDKGGWEPVAHHIYRQSSFKADIHLTIDEKVNQTRLVTDGGRNRPEHPVGLGAVLYGDRLGVKRIQGSRDLWHVTDVLESQRNGDRWFRLWDGTHTTMLWCHEDDLLADFSPAGWTWPTGRKPLYHLTRECGVEDEADLMTDGGVDRPEHPVSHVVVLRGASKNRYHRDDGNGDPACPVLERSDRDTPARSLWDIEKADAWREPCQYDACFGNRDGWSDDRKVVLPTSTEVPADD